MAQQKLAAGRAAVEIARGRAGRGEWVFSVFGPPPRGETPSRPAGPIRNLGCDPRWRIQPSPLPPVARDGGVRLAGSRPRGAGHGRRTPPKSLEPAGIDCLRI